MARFEDRALHDWGYDDCDLGLSWLGEVKERDEDEVTTLEVKERDMRMRKKPNTNEGERESECQLRVLISGFWMFLKLFFLNPYVNS